MRRKITFTNSGGQGVVTPCPARGGVNFILRQPLKPDAPEKYGKTGRAGKDITYRYSFQFIIS